MLNDENGALGHADGNPAILPGGTGDLGVHGYSRRTQLFIFLCISVACWLPIMVLAYLFF